MTTTKTDKLLRRRNQYRNTTQPVSFCHLLLLLSLIQSHTTPHTTPQY
ncbi:MAG: hypothetical protein ACI8RD_009333, partial [Bacillariaceae sp.]